LITVVEQLRFQIKKIPGELENYFYSSPFLVVVEVEKHYSLNEPFSLFFGDEQSELV